MLTRAIAAHLARGGMIAYPTEFCYGLGCDPRNRNAVMRLLKLKQRPQRKGLILIAGKYSQLAPYLQDITFTEQATLKADGAKAITWLMVPAYSSRNCTILRPLTESDGPRRSTSSNSRANPAGEKSLRITSIPRSAWLEVMCREFMNPFRKAVAG